MDTNESKFKNYRCRVLRGNWYEERAVDEIDSNDPHWLQHGHKCLFTTEPMNPDQYISTTHETYVPFVQPITAKIPSKKDLMERFVYDKHIKNFNMEQMPEELATEYRTETRDNFSADGFQPKKIEMPDDIRSLTTEAPLTFWSEKLQKITNMSDRPRRTNFKRNYFFTKSITLDI